MKIANIFIIHYTYGWTQDLIESWEKYLPDQSLIVFNNNPSDGQLVDNTRGSFGNDLFLNNLCQKEIKYLKNKKIVELIVNLPNKKDKKISKLLTHGQCLNFIFNYCSNLGFDYLLHIEPDCVLHGKCWLNSMIKKLSDYWLIGYGGMNQSKHNFVMQMCPTLWNIKKTLDVMKNKNIDFEKNQYKDMNTGQAIMQEFLSLNKCNVVGNTFDFCHFNDGTKNLHKKSIIKLF